MRGALHLLRRWRLGRSVVWLGLCVHLTSSKPASREADGAHMHGCTRACICPSLVLAFFALQVPASDAGLRMNSTPLHVKSGEVDGSAVDATLAGLPLDLSGIF